MYTVYITISYSKEQTKEATQLIPSSSHSMHVNVVETSCRSELGCSEVPRIRRVVATIDRKCGIEFVHANFRGAF